MKTFRWTFYVLIYHLLSSSSEILLQKETNNFPQIQIICMLIFEEKCQNILRFTILHFKQENYTHTRKCFSLSFHTFIDTCMKIIVKLGAKIINCRISNIAHCLSQKLLFKKIRFEHLFAYFLLIFQFFLYSYIFEIHHSTILNRHYVYCKNNQFSEDYFFIHENE